jgi:hypothetical protein
MSRPTSPRVPANAQGWPCCDREEGLNINKTTLNKVRSMAVLQLVL